MKPALVLLALAMTLSACGVDGPPIPPSRDAGLTISGSASIGIKVGG
ncbi:MAG: argininosuccinate lyase [Rhodobacteraceae bacterium]|nr:argininosuccinate lyase [Paracoccaceae bacterium]